MNIETGHLVNEKMMEEIDNDLYVKLHGAQADDAEKVLAGKDEAVIKVFGGGLPNSSKEEYRLDRFARNKRKKLKKMTAKFKVKNGGK